jgi:hypothetical protein
MRGVSVWSISSWICCGLGLILGFSVSIWFLVLLVYSCFIIPVLRVTGYLKDLDQEHLEAYAKAALFSHTVIGLYITVTIVLIGAQLVRVRLDSFLISCFSVLLISFYLSYIVEVWENKSAGRIICLLIVLFWMGYITIEVIGLEAWKDVLLVQSLSIVLPLVAALILSWRVPVFSGLFILAAACFHFFFFDAYASLMVSILLPIPEWIAGYLLVRSYFS